MTITRRSLLQSFSAVLAALGWSKRPTVGQVDIPRPHIVGADWASAESVTVFDFYRRGSDGVYRLAGRAIGDSFIQFDSPVTMVDMKPWPWEPRSKYAEIADATKELNRIASGVQDVKRIEHDS